MVTRRRLVIALVASALAAPFASLAQQTKKIPLVGVLHPGFPPPVPASPAIVALQQGLRDSGYVEGQTIAVEYRYGGGKPETMPRLALELVKLKVDVLVAVGSPSISAAKPVAGAIPIVATDLQTDAVASGLVASLAKPGGNITGLFLDFGGLMGKWLELLTEAVPGIRRAAVLWDATTEQSQLHALAAAAKTLSIELEVVKFQQAAEIEAVLTSALKQRSQAFIQLSSPVLLQATPRVAKFTQANRLPAISMYPAFPEAGGLMSYGPNIPIFWRRIWPLVDKILKGGKPGDIPLERPTIFELVVNMKTAKALGLTIPNSILVRADKVIE